MEESRGGHCPWSKILLSWLQVQRGKILVNRIDDYTTASNVCYTPVTRRSVNAVTPP